ncbi:hypothetical protein Dsin_030932 [Dipteronia sinensis]|uniref:Chalcone-flavonone isomerase family protein n=1 Tax=Dipteronia sinensis TaxID=43782 RepID=A0AAE0DRL6_9ROSI|nr:hypothetical protein Dsin_030932 [Dipteronia sinensis]
METTVEEVTAKVESLVVHDKADNGNLAKEKVNCESGTKAGAAATAEQTNEKVHEEKEVAVEVEPKTGVSFPVKLDDGKQLICVGLRKKSMLGIGIKIYAFGIYADNENLKDLLRSKGWRTPIKTNKGNVSGSG